MVVHWRHGLADRIQGHVHLPLHSVAVREQSHKLHHNLDDRKQQKLFIIPKLWQYCTTNSSTSTYHLRGFHVILMNETNSAPVVGRSPTVTFHSENFVLTSSLKHVNGNLSAFILFYFFQRGWQKQSQHTGNLAAALKLSITSEFYVLLTADATDVDVQISTFLNGLQVNVGLKVRIKSLILIWGKASNKTTAVHLAVLEFSVISHYLPCAEMCGYIFCFCL